MTSNYFWSREARSALSTNLIDRNILQIGKEIQESILKKQLIESSTDLLLTISGGQDSIFLLFFLSLFKTQIALSFKAFCCNHFWQNTSFYTTLHLTKYAVSSSFPFIGSIPLTQLTRIARLPSIVYLVRKPLLKPHSLSPNGFARAKLCLLFAPVFPRCVHKSGFALANCLCTFAPLHLCTKGAIRCNQVQSGAFVSEAFPPFVYTKGGLVLQIRPHLNPLYIYNGGLVLQTRPHLNPLYIYNGGLVLQRRPHLNPLLTNAPLHLCTFAPKVQLGAIRCNQVQKEFASANPSGGKGKGQVRSCKQDQTRYIFIEGVGLVYKTSLSPNGFAKAKFRLSFTLAKPDSLRIYNGGRQESTFESFFWRRNLYKDPFCGPQGFASVNSLCTKGAFRGFGLVCKTSPDPLCVHNGGRQIKSSALYGAKSKAAKCFVPLFSESTARNWRHITTERSSSFYTLEKTLYGHTLNDRIETMLFNLIRGAGNRGVTPLLWERKASRFTYNKFYCSSEQLRKNTHIRQI